MKSKLVGENTSEVEVTHISMSGIWVLIQDKEYFLPFEKFPLFRSATVGAIHNVLVVDEGTLRWPELNLNVTLETIGDPHKVQVIST